MQIEIIKAAKYYKNKAPGYVVLVDGDPHHVLALKVAKNFANKLQGDKCMSE